MYKTITRKRDNKRVRIFFVLLALLKLSVACTPITHAPPVAIPASEPQSDQPTYTTVASHPGEQPLSLPAPNRPTFMTTVPR
jgi:hypothetical protein